VVWPRFTLPTHLSLRTAALQNPAAVSLYESARGGGGASQISHIEWPFPAWALPAAVFFFYLLSHLVHIIALNAPIRAGRSLPQREEG